MKKFLYTLGLASSFFAGVYFSDFEPDRFLGYRVRDGFYPNPYDLKVVRKVVCGEVETYLVDSKRRKYQKIGPKMYVGNLGYRIRGVIYYPFEKNFNLLDDIVQVLD